ncbi:MAG: helix-turn-helix domain-containing protein [Bryobacteraceae bacterium]|jgi:hypothetical protein
MLFAHLPPITPMSCESPSPREKCPNRWRKGSVFDRGGEFRRPVSTKARALVMDRAEALERSTKAPGQRDGVLGQSALMILRALLCHFLDTKSGRCDPSYKQIQKQTGFCVQTIAVALKRLERAGILDITRRMARKGAKLWNEFMGRFVWREWVEQQTNAYMVNVPVPDRTEFGDLGMPLFKPKPSVSSDSTSQRESTSRFIHRLSAARRRIAFRGS